MRSLVRVLLALVPIQCQRASPVRGVVKKEALFSANSSIVIQQGCEKDTAMKQLESVPPNYETARLWNSMAGSGPGARWPSREVLLSLGSSALLRPSWSILPCCTPPAFSALVRSVRCFNSSWETVFNFWPKENVNFPSHKEDELQADVPNPVPNLSIIMQMRTPIPCPLIGTKDTVLIGCNADTLISQGRG